jgi:hypothetical protein
MNRMGEVPWCVLCRKRPVSDPWRPFCSQRCRIEDLARWAEGRYRVAGESGPAAPDPEREPAELHEDNPDVD